MAKLLVIDDDEAVRVLLRTILEAVGHEILVADGGDEGMRLLESTSVDLVITDILMPEKDGLAVIRELADSHPGVKIIGLSGGGMILSAKTSLQAAEKMGVSQTLSKPFTSQQVLDVIDAALATPPS
ncbi:MAG: response regulator [Magnetococcales bacterium]|nr:response regulator [Magnetococcales bacterium]